MDHVAIMKKEWELIDKILSGEKTIESRWYSSKKIPWNRIRKGETIYFKNSGDPVSAKAKVVDVKQYENYTNAQLREIIDKYAGKGEICFVWGKGEVYNWAKDKKYCILIFLGTPQSIEPFDIDKTGFGNMASWICVENIDNIKN